MSGGGGPAAGRRIVGNLDCESDYAAAAGRPIGPLPARVLQAIAGAATLLRAFARDGDRLWLPAMVPPEAVADVPGLPRPILESGPFEGLSRLDDVLAWSETAAVAGLRASDRRKAPREADSLQNLPWHLPAASPGSAAEVNDRGFCWHVAGELGCRLPGARLVASPRELESHLGAGGVRTKACEGWVLKARFSAAGRWRYIHRGGAPARRRVERLFERHGELLFEPWMERTADFGCAAAVTADGALPISLHRLLVDGSGRFTGIELRAGDRGLEGPWLTAAERADLERVLEGVSGALRQAGYSGPFGIDGWRYRLAGGGDAFHPLGEINGRMTFGLVARALVDRLRGPLGLDPGTRVRLVFGTAQPRRDGVAMVRLYGGPEASGREIRLEVCRPMNGAPEG